MKLDEVMARLEGLGSEQTRQVLMRHGARDPLFGVKVEDLKKLQKAIKEDHELALALYETGNSDAMYLAGMIAVPARMSRADLQRWVEGAYWHMLAEYTVAQLAAESPLGMELAREWIESDQEHVASAGWSTLAGVMSLVPDAELPVAELDALLERVVAELDGAPNRVRYTMNAFVIAAGSFVAPLHDRALAVARRLGAVKVDMGGTACKVPHALEYIGKVAAAGRLGRKRASTRC